MRKTLPKALISMTGGDPRAKSEPSPKYSGRFPVPPLGSYVAPMIPYAGVKPPVAAGVPMRVIGYDVEHGWLYLVCRHPSGRGTVYVAGCDLPAPVTVAGALPTLADVIALLKALPPDSRHPDIHGERGAIRALEAIAARS